MAIWGVRRPDVRADVVAEIFSQSRPNSPACVKWRKVLLPVVVSFKSHPPDPEEHYLLQGLDEHLDVECEAMSGDEWRNNFSIACVLSKHHMDWVFAFFQHIYYDLLSDWHSNTLKSLYWSLRHECQPIQRAVFKFLDVGITRCCFPHRQYPINSSLLHSRQNLKQKHACAKSVI